jgi:hypothetical protein
VGWNPLGGELLLRIRDERKASFGKSGDEENW